MLERHKNISVEQISVGMMEVNCYLIWETASREGIIVDPGDEGHDLLHLIEDKGLKIVAIVLTHGHADHIGGVDILRKNLHAKLAIGRNDADMLVKSALNLSDLFGDPIVLRPAEILLSEGDEIAIGSEVLRVLETPGHTKGSVCLLGDGFVISGDLIFAGSIGRVDLPGGDYNEIISSIKNKILPLGDDVAIYPGHGPKTSVAQEKIYNPFLIGG